MIHTIVSLADVFYGATVQGSVSEWNGYDWSAYSSVYRKAHPSPRFSTVPADHLNIK